MTLPNRRLRLSSSGDGGPPAATAVAAKGRFCLPCPCPSLPFETCPSERLRAVVGARLEAADALRAAANGGALPPPELAHDALSFLRELVSTLQAVSEHMGRREGQAGSTSVAPAAAVAPTPASESAAPAPHANPPQLDTEATAHAALTHSAAPAAAPLYQAILAAIATVAAAPGVGAAVEEDAARGGRSVHDTLELLELLISQVDAQYRELGAAGK